MEAGVTARERPVSGERETHEVLIDSGPGQEGGCMGSGTLGDVGIQLP